MSLLNRMLQDLDARQGTGQPVVRLHDDVRSLPSRASSSRSRVVAAVALALAGAAGAAYFFSQREQAPFPVTPVLAVSVMPQANPQAPVVVESAVGGAPVEKAPEVGPEKEIGKAPEKMPEKALEKVGSSAQRLPMAAPAPIVKSAPPVKAPRVDAPTVPQSSARKPAEAEKTRPLDASRQGAETSHPTKLQAIEKTDAAGSARERAESEYRKALGVINQGRGAEGVAGLQQALRLDGTHVGARQLLVRLLLEARQGDEAMRTLQEGLERVPSQSTWAMTLARLQVERDDLAGAAQTLERSLPAGAGSANYQGFAGHVLYRLGRNREAVDHYLVATRLAPADGRWWLGLGLAYDADGRVTEAREALQRAKASGNLSPELSVVVDQRLR